MKGGEEITIQITGVNEVFWSESRDIQIDAGYIMFYLSSNNAQHCKVEVIVHTCPNC